MRSSRGNIRRRWRRRFASPKSSRCRWKACSTTTRTREPKALGEEDEAMIRKLSTGEYRLYSRKKNPRTGKRRNLGTFTSLAAAKKHERPVQYFKRAG